MEEQPQNALPSRACQLRALAAAFLAALLVIIALIWHGLSTKSTPALPRMVQGSFRPDSKQWKNIMMGTVTTRKFIGLVSVDCSVAIDDDIQAPSSSPASVARNFEKLWLVGKVREEDAPQMKLGQAVDVSFAALPGRRFPAKLTWVSPAIDHATHHLAVRAEIANPSGVLKPAMLATMAIHIGADRVSPAIPEIAVIHEGDQARVWALAGHERLILRTIKPGRLQDGFTEVLKGLAPGDHVALGAGILLGSTAR